MQIISAGADAASGDAVCEWLLFLELLESWEQGTGAQSWALSSCVLLDLSAGLKDFIALQHPSQEGYLEASACLDATGTKPGLQNSHPAEPG